MSRIILPAVFVCLFVCGTSIHSSKIEIKWPCSQQVVNEILNLVGKKCELKNATKLYEVAKFDNKECVTSLMNEMMNDAAAITIYNVYAFVEKYNKKLPKIKKCYRIFTSILEVCLDEGEKETLNIWLNIIESFYSLVFLETEMFFTEQDPSCFKRKSIQILGCYDSSFSRYVSSGEANLNNMPVFKFEEGQCKSMTKLETCVLAEIETCRSQTTTNLVKAFFDVMRRSSPCSKFERVQLPEENNLLEDTPQSPALYTALTIFDLYRIASNRR